MSKKKFIDFDEMWKERDTSPVIVRMYGQDWELPSALPASVMLEANRLRAEEGDEAEVSKAQMEVVLSQIVPEETLKQWFAHGLGVDQYGDIIRSLIELYNSADEDDEGEAHAPDDGAPPSA